MWVLEERKRERTDIDGGIISLSECSPNINIILRVRHNETRRLMRERLLFFKKSLLSQKCILPLIKWILLSIPHFGSDIHIDNIYATNPYRLSYTLVILLEFCQTTIEAHLHELGKRHIVVFIVDTVTVKSEST